MFGSYIGAVISVLMPSILTIPIDSTNKYIIYLAFLSSIIISAVLGFLVGWGINSIYRALRK